MVLPKLRILLCCSYFVCLCKPDYMAKWKDMEKLFGEYPIQNIIGDKEAYKKFKTIKKIGQ